MVVEIWSGTEAKDCRSKAALIEICFTAEEDSYELEGQTDRGVGTMLKLEQLHAQDMGGGLPANLKGHLCCQVYLRTRATSRG